MNLVQARFLIFLLLIWICGLPSLARADDPMRVVVAMPGPGAAPFLPVELIPKIGADRKMGIELGFRYFGGGPLAVKDMAGRNSDFAGLALAALGGLSLKLDNLRSVVPLTQAPAYTLMVRADLKQQVRTVKDLYGRTIGTHTGTKSGKSTGQQLSEFLLTRSGLSLESVNFVPAGQSEDEYQAALASGAVDAMMVNEPFASLLEQFHVAYRLVDLHNPKVAAKWLGGPFLYTQLATRQELLDQEPEKVRRLVGAVQLALHWIHSHSPEQIVAALDIPADKRPALIRFLRANKNVFNPSGKFSDAQIRTADTFFHEVSRGNLKARQRQLSDLVDARWAGRSR